VYSILLENALLVCRVAIMYGMYAIMVKPKPTLKRMRQSTTSEQWEGYNNVLDRAFRHGNYDGKQFVKQLTQLMDQGEVDLTTDKIVEAGRDRSAVSTANYISYNPICQKEQTFFGEALNRADHVNGAGWSNTLTGTCANQMLIREQGIRGLMA
jgi:hypothetical protein